MGQQMATPAPLSPGPPRAEERSAQATVVAWRQYRQACELHLRLAPPPPGPVCNRSFDLYACWGDAVPNSTATVPCPWYLPWYPRGSPGERAGAASRGQAGDRRVAVQGGVVARRCGPDGRWVTDDSGRTWQDNSQCEDLAQVQPLERQVWLLEQFRLLYTVGYSLSLVALLVALLLLLLLRRLRCTRNLIHANLFVSFALRAAAILTRDALLPHPGHQGHQGHQPGHHPGHPLQLLGAQAGPACRVAQSLAQYCVGANYAWATAEGLHLLHLLLGTPGRSHLPALLLLGWGVPVLFVVPWVILRYLYENEGCWERNEKVAVWGLIRCPILAAVAVNFVVFVRIVRILVAKVRAQQVARGDTRLRLARSTLTLIPLLGVHEVIFALAGEGEGGGGLRLARLCLHLLLTSAQGLVVSVLYCFTNKEVQAEVRRGWQRCRTGVPGPPRAPPRGQSRRGRGPVAESGC
ncbi:LOW QUALITY PROTEIN: gastric inhibitory polypeptide receptor [Haemorhous mexicanus]|uniref:LOW QUALITY PROTEIN: gastric inhibitory polypeptide receptor n=1 Tax=Haemorhous mexicanus TaxID=30427 RepID=UPI0028BE8C19|nr:LOW QUALITY PROTEIN: gastric inhibitory polypeptide receptor [Haemorhous mexicanus]